MMKNERGGLLFCQSLNLEFSFDLEMSCFGRSKPQSQSLSKALKSRYKVACEFIERIPKNIQKCLRCQRKKNSQMGDDCGYIQIAGQYIMKTCDQSSPSRTLHETNLLLQEHSFALSFMSSSCKGKLMTYYFTGLFFSGTLYSGWGEKASQTHKNDPNSSAYINKNEMPTLMLDKWYDSSQSRFGSH